MTDPTLVTAPLVEPYDRLLKEYDLSRTEALEIVETSLNNALRIYNEAGLDWCTNDLVQDSSGYPVSLDVESEDPLGFDFLPDQPHVAKCCVLGSVDMGVIKYGAETFTEARTRARAHTLTRHHLYAELSLEPTPADQPTGDDWTENGWISIAGWNDHLPQQEGKARAIALITRARNRLPQLRQAWKEN